MATYELTFQSVNIPTDSGGASVTVEEDSDSDGTVENSDTISLSDGTTSYTTSDVFDGSGQVRLDFNLGPPSDVTTTVSIVGPVDVTVKRQAVIKTMGGVSYDLTFDAVNIPTDSGGASVTVEEDSDSDGTVENTDTVSLSDGQTSYTTSDVFDGSGQVRLDFNLGPPSDVTTTVSIVGPVDVTVKGQAGPVIKTRDSVIQTQ